MQLDQNAISIRERTLAEILDLALLVTQRHFFPLFALLVLGAAPWVFINDQLFQAWFFVDEIEYELSGYFFALIILVACETPFATALLTLYLGQATFSPQIDARRLIRDFLGSLPQMVLLQGLLRILMVPLWVTMLLPYASWPYLSELILLERNPLFRGKSRRITTMRRSRNLHRRNSGELLVRWIVASIVGIGLWIALAGALYVAWGPLIGRLPSASFYYRWIVPLALWIVVGFLAVVRFLCYLDIRIRGEGWEVELVMRAEAHRLSRLGVAT